MTADAAHQMTERVYAALRDLADREFAQERVGHTLQPTALVHEAFLRLDRSPSDWSDDDAFLGAAVTAMRRVLVDHARGRSAHKRGGTGDEPARRCDVALDGLAAMEVGPRLVELDDVLARLATLDERRARVAELRLFGGLPFERIADLCDVARSTVLADWAVARSWLGSQLSADEGT